MQYNVETIKHHQTLQFKVRKKESKIKLKKEREEEKKRKETKTNAKCLSMSDNKIKVISMTRQITEQVKLKKKTILILDFLTFTYSPL